MKLCEIEHPSTMECINLNWVECISMNIPNIIITNPHACCYDNIEQKCDQISRKRRNQLLDGSSHHDIKLNDGTIRLIHSKTSNKIGIIPLIHRNITDLNRSIAINSGHFEIFNYLINLGGTKIILDVHSYSKEHNWNNKSDHNTHLVILYSQYGKSKFHAELIQEFLTAFNYNIIIIQGSNNLLIDEASKLNKIALLLEFPDFGKEKISKLLINDILFFLNNMYLI